MEDSGTILCQISMLKDMLDQVNEEIEFNIQITREIESDIVKCTEMETVLAARESDLTKSLFTSHFEIDGLLSVAADSRNSVKLLEEELLHLTVKQAEVQKRRSKKREDFCKLCLEFQRDIGSQESDEIACLLSEKELLQNEITLLEKKNNALKNSMLAFVEELLQDVHNSTYALNAEIQSRNQENEKLLKEINDLKSKFLSM